MAARALRMLIRDGARVMIVNAGKEDEMGVESNITHLCPPLRSTFAVRETASLGIMGEPRVPSLNPSETIVL